ncbi:unnamed protein product [Arabidopsis thaliana]|uniref:(thale cress) hypothetical protein n=1 Tax=Arabidopsis thaliana TaxID=3702 RepID=A0A7G2F3F3_ARATH|nr:unnamed protein product [Arabidopsis thaliana]
MGFGQKKQREPTIVLTLLTWHNSVEDRSVIGSSISITNNKNETHKKEKKKRRDMDAIDSVVDPLRDFAKDSIRLVKRCHKPDRKEFTKVAVRTAIGFVVMGFVGFFVKLIFIPINNIIVGAT